VTIVPGGQFLRRRRRRQAAISPDVWYLPTKNAHLLELGWPAIAAGDLWYCDEASGNLIGSVNGLQWAPSGSPTQGESFGGSGGLAAKKAIHGTTTTKKFALTAALAVGTADFSFSVLVRPDAPLVGDQEVIGLSDSFYGYGWGLDFQAGYQYLWIYDDAASHNYISGSYQVYDGSAHLWSGQVDRNGNVVLCYDDETPTTIASVNTGNMHGETAGSFLGHSGQTAWAMLNVGVLAGAAGHLALWNKIKDLI